MFVPVCLSLRALSTGPPLGAKVLSQASSPGDGTRPSAPRRTAEIHYETVSGGAGGAEEMKGQVKFPK